MLATSQRAAQSLPQCLLANLSTVRIPLGSRSQHFLYLTGESCKRTILNVNITVARSDPSVVRGEEMSGEWMRCTDIRHLLIILSV